MSGLRVPFGEALRAEWGAPGRSRLLESSPRSRVWRVELPGERPTVVVKQLVGGTDADERYAREVAALRIGSRAASPVVPGLLAVDPGERVLLLEYLEHRRPAGDWIVDYATALARLHSAAGPEDAGTLPRWRGPTAADIASFLGLAEALGVPVPPGVRGELEGLVERLGRAPGHALLHGDPCPGNDLHTSAGIRFVDFEQACLGSGLMELAYLRIGFPTCWCVTSAPEALLERAERAYREEWRTLTGAGVPFGASAPGGSSGSEGSAGSSGSSGSEAPSGPAEGALVDACAGWLVRGDALVQRAHRDGTDHLARIPRRDWTWGTASARERLLHRLGVVGRMTVGHEALGELGLLCTALRGRMLPRWPTLRPVPRERPEE
ncbi:phosphotransferase [Streptomyces sp. NPDC097619]|uniref:phosphotransferase n=1 Tax=Streptomyces sp. NPDC097619 TaxID=3157228 RepID=UPI0033192354